MAAGYRRQSDNPSFSSSLLDSIYRSIDERGKEGSVGFGELTSEKRSRFAQRGIKGDFEDDQLRRAYMIEKWMKEKIDERVVVGRRSAVERYERDWIYYNSSSTSSDSSSGVVFSSSEAESLSGATIRPKPIRTGTDQHSSKTRKQYDAQTNPKHEGKFLKTKLRALKMYGDLKKVKQPISPGGRLATFLNSIFTTGNAKKSKITSSGNGYSEAPARSQLDRKSKSANASTCSSASSFSRSCLSKTPSSRGKLSNGVKRSVRFFPVSVIVDEDCQPCGQKSLHTDQSEFNSGNDKLNMHLNEKNRHVEEIARNLLKNYHKKVEYESESNNINNEEDEKDDTESYSSSDLFELDNLSAIGIERYRKELPVYETTHLDTNRAIASGFFV